MMGRVQLLPVRRSTVTRASRPCERFTTHARDARLTAMPLFFGIILLAATSCSSPRRYTAEPPATPPGVASRNVVVWISIDGFRQDYVDRNVSPFLRKLMHEGSYSQKLVPITPSLT